MYGTVARICVKKGAEERLWALTKEESMIKVPGYIGQFVYRMDEDPNTLYLAVIFADKESYFANARSPEQDMRYREMVELLEGEPEWHDGEIVFSQFEESERQSKAA